MTVCIVLGGRARQEAWDEYRKGCLDYWAQYPAGLHVRVLRFWQRRTPPRSVVWVK